MFIMKYLQRMAKVDLLNKVDKKTSHFAILFTIITIDKRKWR